jgi:hypothetical protein
MLRLRDPKLTRKAQSDTLTMATNHRPAVSTLVVMDTTLHDEIPDMRSSAGEDPLLDSVGEVVAARDWDMIGA